MAGRPKKTTTRSVTTAKPTAVSDKTGFRLSFRWRLIIASVLAAILLVVANSAIWVNRAIFDTDTFTSTAVTSLTSDSSRQALASEVVDRALADRPVLKNIAGDTATKLVSGILGSNQFNRVLTAAVSRLHIYLTSNDRKSIALDLSGVKNIVGNVLTIAGNNGVDTQQAENRVSNVPDQITIVDSNNIPNLYSYGLVFLWLGPICALLAAGLLAYPYLRKSAPYYKIAWVQGLILVVAGFMALLLGPLFRPPVLANITSGNLRIVVGNLYDSFTALFNQQTMVVIGVGVTLAVLPAVFNSVSVLYAKRHAKK